MVDSSDHIGAADSSVAAEGTLWAEFLDLLQRYGTVERHTQRGLVFRSSGEESTRELVITSSDLRSVFVSDLARSAARGESIRKVDRLPDWFTDQITEFIGSVEEPYEDPYVVLTSNGKPAPSRDGIHPDRRSPWGR